MISFPFIDVNTDDSEKEVIPGEGAAFFFLETPEGAQQRDCRVYAEIQSCTGSLFSSPKDVASVINESLAQAHLQPDDIDLIVGSQAAQAFYSPSVLESMAGCFANRVTPLPIRSPIPYLGYTRAAGGAFDLALAISVLETQKLPDMLQLIESPLSPPFSYDDNHLEKDGLKTILVVSIGLTDCVYSMVIRRPDK